MTKFKVLIATPAFGGAVFSAYTEALLGTCMLLSQHGIEFNVKFINNQLVTRARNMLSSCFMNDSSFTHMLFIDADIVWRPEHVLMLLQHDEECTIGVYPNKRYFWENGNLIIKPSSSMLPTTDEVKPPLQLVKYAATGFMLLKRSALEKIQNDVEEFLLPNGKEMIRLHNYWDCKVINEDYLTEDYYFSYLFNKNGGKIYADMRIELRHIGPHEYGELILNKENPGV